MTTEFVITILIISALIPIFFHGSICIINAHRKKKYSIPTPNHPDSSHTRTNKVGWFWMVCMMKIFLFLLAIWNLQHKFSEYLSNFKVDVEVAVNILSGKVCLLLLTMMFLYLSLTAHFFSILLKKPSTLASGTATKKDAHFSQPAQMDWTEV